MANQLVCKHSRTAPANWAYDVAIVSLEDAETQAQQLLQKLRLVDSLRVWPKTGESPSLHRMCDFAREDSPAVAATVILVVHSRLLWAGEETLLWSRLKNFLGGKKILAIFAPGGGASPDDPPRQLTPLDMRRGWQVKTLCRLLQPSQDPAIDAPAGGKPTLIAKLHTPTIERTTGLNLLWVPGGTFMMGSNKLDSDSRPPHLVKLSPFWIGETPVTNQQYRVFVEATGHHQSIAWRNRRFNDPQQPVVTVSRVDAIAFCEWLSERSGWTVSLPSEAQWEFAARGEDGRTYPWGEERPKAARAHFGQGDGGAPTLVGSCPAGMGPFGTLDQAGNVWEWCADVWDAKIYRQRPPPPAITVDPMHHGGNSNRYAVRGGSWRNSRGALAAAFRSGNWLLNFVNASGGFRVVVAREPVDP